MTNDLIMSLKRQLANEIVAMAKGMETSVAARRFGIDIARLCDLRKGRIARFSIERLIQIIAKVDGKVTLTIDAPHANSINWIPTLRAKRGLLPMEFRRLEARKRLAARLDESGSTARSASGARGRRQRASAGLKAGFGKGWPVRAQFGIEALCQIRPYGPRSPSPTALHALLSAVRGLAVDRRGVRV